MWFTKGLRAVQVSGVFEEVCSGSPAALRLDSQDDLLEEEES